MQESIGKKSVEKNRRTIADRKATSTLESKTPLANYRKSIPENKKPSHNFVGEKSFVDKKSSIADRSSFIGMGSNFALSPKQD